MFHRRTNIVNSSFDWTQVIWLITGPSWSLNRLWNGRFLMSWSHRNLRIRFSAKLLFLQKKLTTYRANSQHPQWQKKRFGWICGSVLLYVKLPWNFPLRFESPRDLCCLQPWQHSVCQLCQCLWDHLRTLLLVVIVAKVSNYSAKKKIKILHKQGLHPAEILKALKREGLLVSFSSTTCIIRMLHLTGSMANLPWSGRPQKLSMEANTVCENSAK